MDLDRVIETAIRDGIKEGIKNKLQSCYGDNPISKVLDSCIATQAEAFREILNESLAACVKDKEFREQVAISVRHTLAKTLISRFGGELEKQVNVLKSDPATRARITLAIEEIVKSKAV